MLTSPAMANDSSRQGQFLTLGSSGSIWPLLPESPVPPGNVGEEVDRFLMEPARVEAAGQLGDQADRQSASAVGWHRRAGDTEGENGDFDMEQLEVGVDFGMSMKTDRRHCRPATGELLRQDQEEDALLAQGHQQWADEGGFEPGMSGRTDPAPGADHCPARPLLVAACGFRVSPATGVVTSSTGKLP
jgi:hypothetical protein